jgi:hypothetical protein
MIKLGDLVHLPAETHLLGRDPGDRPPLPWYSRLEKPSLGIVLGASDIHFKIMVENNIWFVRKQDAYPIDNGDLSDN